MNIIHRDLKPENILIVNKDINGLPRVKICDFGTSKIIEKGVQQKIVVGTSLYIAPEVIEKNYNEKCDIWSCGIILYTLLCAEPLFQGKDDEEIMKHVKQFKIDTNIHPFNKFSFQLNDLLKKLLETDPLKRISAEQALNHNWFKQNQSQEIFNRINDETIIRKLIKNLKNYKSNSIIQETALAYLVHNFPQMIDVVNACKLFNQIDLNGDGKISQEELLKGLQKQITSKTLEKDVKTIYENIDMDKNGYLQYEEFVRGAIDKEKLIKDNILKFAFKYFDKNSSGEITIDEIETVFKDSIIDKDKNKIKDALQKIIKQVDLNGNGKISFEEFEILMKKMIKK